LTLPPFLAQAVRNDRAGTLTCDDGNGNIVYRQERDFTDFPLPEIALYFTCIVPMLREDKSAITEGH